MALKIIGKVFSIGTLQTISSKNGGQPFTKRELIIDATRFDGLTGERGFDNYPAFEFSGDKCAELDRLTTGQVVEVSFELQGSFYKDSSGVYRLRFPALRPCRAPKAPCESARRRHMRGAKA